MASDTLYSDSEQIKGDYASQVTFFTVLLTSLITYVLIYVLQY